MITGIPNVANPSLNVEETFNFKEDISKLSGKHAFKFGYDLMRLRRNNYTIDNSAGTFTLAGTNGLNANGSSIPNTGGNALSQLLVGAVSSYTITTKSTQQPAAQLDPLGCTSRTTGKSCRT